MAKRPINIIGGFYKDPNLHWSRQDTLNWIPVKAEREGTLTPWQLRDAPGVKPFVRITRTVETDDGPVVIDVGPIRGMRNVEGKLFVVAAQTVYQIGNTGVAVPLGTIPGVGRVSMAHNQYGLANQLIIVNGSAGYIVDTAYLTVTKITDEGYPGAFVADYIDQFLAQVEPQGRFWFHSDLANGTDYNTLDRYEAEADPDRIVSLLVSHREVLVFGRDTIEPFVNTGGQTGTFERASNTVIEVGCAAKFTPRKLDNSVFWLDDKRIVRRLDGYTPVRISTDAIDAAFSECTAAQVAAAYAFTWETRGHKVYYITVPGVFTFGYDVLTGQWHRRCTSNMKHWDAVDAVLWNGQWIIGSGQNGRLYILDQNYKLDRCDPLVRKRTTGKLWDAENEMTLNNVELKFNTGGPVSVCVLFPDQPLGPSISGEAPDSGVGVAYSYSYTTTPGDAPIARTILMPGSTNIAAFGLTWDEVTATVSGTLTQLGPITLIVRTIDTNGLFAQLTDEFRISSQFEILISGSYLATDGPVICSTLSIGEPDFLAIPQSSGADVIRMMPAYFDGDYALVSRTASRSSTAIAGPWASGSIAATADVEALMGGENGWMAFCGTVFPCEVHATNGPGNVFVETTPTTSNPAFQPTLDSVFRSWKFRDRFYLLYYRFLFSTDDPFAEQWEVAFNSSPQGNGPTVLRSFMDFAEYNGEIYATAVTNAPVYQIRKITIAEDGQVTASDDDIVMNGVPAPGKIPIQLCTVDVSDTQQVLLAYCIGGGLLSSQDNFTNWIDIGIIGPTVGTEDPEKVVGGRRIVSGGGKAYIIGSGVDGNKCVMFDPVNSVVLGTYTLPIQNVIGITAREL